MTHIPHTDRLAAWFPLVPRARPACLPLRQRIDEINRLAAAEPGEMTTYTQALNKAALIASDCGMPKLANRMCWQQFDVFADAGPWDARLAEAAMEPLINIGRLAIRDDAGTRAYTIFRRLFDATGFATPLIGDRKLNLSDLLPEGDDRQQIRRQLWATLLSDGTRALTRAGQWDQALAHVRRFKGIGDRLMDGRQVAIIAAYTADDLATATELCEHTQCHTDWERAVAAYLHTLTQRANGRADDTTDKAMIDRYLALGPELGQTLFRTRLGLSILDLTRHHDHAQALADRIITEAIAARDAYTASDIFNHPKCHQHLTDQHKRALSDYLAAARLRLGTIPDDLADRLHNAFTTAQTRLRDTIIATSKPTHRA